MAEENLAPVAPVVTSPAPAVVEPSSSAPAPAPTPQVDSTPAVASVSPPSQATALGSEPVSAEVTPPVAPESITPPAEGDAPIPNAESNPSADPAPLPTYEPFTFPEGVTVEDTKLGQFTKDLAEFEVTTKADHAAMQAFGQKLLDRYTAELTESTTRINDYYTTAFEKTKSDWKEAFTNDPEIGGNRQQTTVKSAVDAIQRFGGSAEQTKALREHFEATGTGNYPGLIRLVTNMKAEIDRLSNENVKMLPGKAPMVSARSKVATRYGN